MDILERIIEAVAQKLISMKLEENQYSYSETPDTGDANAGKKSGSSNPRNKPKTKQDTSKLHKKGFVAPEGTKTLTSKEAGASGNKRRRFSRGGDLASGTAADPHNRAARGRKIKPEIGTTSGPGGGKENRRGVHENIQRITNILLEKKSGRCWKGYKPTPGVKAYDKGSCQPK